MKRYRPHLFVAIALAIVLLAGAGFAVLQSFQPAAAVALPAEISVDQAAKLRDRIEVVERTLVRQRVVRAVPGDVDAVGWFRDEAEVTAAVLHVREGRLSDAHSYSFRSEGEEAEALADRVGVIDHGKLLVVEEKEALLRSHGGGSLEEVFLRLVGAREGTA